MQQQRGVGDVHGIVGQWQGPDIGLQEAHAVGIRQVTPGNGQHFVARVPHHHVDRPHPGEAAGEVTGARPDVEHRSIRPAVQERVDRSHTLADAAGQAVEHGHLAEVGPQLGGIELRRVQQLLLVVAGGQRHRLRIVRRSAAGAVVRSPTCGLTRSSRRSRCTLVGSRVA
jgi:hypothetical protein